MKITWRRRKMKCGKQASERERMLARFLGARKWGLNAEFAEEMQRTLRREEKRREEKRREEKKDSGLRS
jgi:hypothetical protein